MADNTCACCGAIIPEGRHICLLCECENEVQHFHPQIAPVRWIPCSERLPEDGQKCIVCMADKSIRLAVWCGDYGEWGVWQISKKLYRTRTVPAWMPMPDAYEPTEKE